MPAGRPTKLTREIIEEVKKYLPTVLYLETVADYLGIARMTWRNWLRRGRAEANRLAKDSQAKPKRSEVLYLEFLDAYKKAIAEGEMFAIGVIRQAASKRPSLAKTTTKTAPDGTKTVTEETKYFAPEWYAAAWIGERRYNRNWGSDRDTIRELQKTIQELQETVKNLVPVVAKPEAQGQPPAGTGPAA